MRRNFSCFLRLFVPGPQVVEHPRQSCQSWESHVSCECFSPGPLRMAHTIHSRQGRSPRCSTFSRMFSAPRSFPVSFLDSDLPFGTIPISVKRNRENLPTRWCQKALDQFKNMSRHVEIRSALQEWGIKKKLKKIKKKLKFRGSWKN